MKNMEKPIHPAPVGKVSQIANLFQRKHIENSIAVVRTESHTTRFNNARALFEKLGVESNSNLSIKISRSNSREDSLCDINHAESCSSQSSDRSISPSKRHSPFPPGGNVAASMVNNNCTQPNGSVSIHNSKFMVEPSPKLHHNISRIKSEDISSSSVSVCTQSMDKPEKPERKFNSRELIEKQKKWTSHFTKTKSSRTHSDQNRCDIIRTGPGTTLITGSDIQTKDNTDFTNCSPNINNKISASDIEMGSSVLVSLANSTLNNPPSPPARQSIMPPEVKPRSCNKMNSPIKSPPLPPLPATKPKNISPIKLLSERIRSPTKIPEHPPPPAKSAVLATSSQHIFDYETKEIKTEKIRKKSINIIEEELLDTLSSSTNIDAVEESSNIMNLALHTSLSGNALSGASSPVHTEDEKQESESTEKSELQQFCNSLSQNKLKNDEDRSSKDAKNYITSPKQSTKRLSSIAVNVHAAGLGSRPPSFICSATPNNDNDENSGEHIDVFETGIFKSTNKAEELSCKNTFVNESYEKQSLNYVDVGFRHNPDGSESSEVFGETQFYKSTNSTDMQKKMHANGFAQETSTVYATIKPEVPPFNEVYHVSITDREYATLTSTKCEVVLSSSSKIVSLPFTHQNDSDIITCASIESDKPLISEYKSNTFTANRPELLPQNVDKTKESVTNSCANGEAIKVDSLESKEVAIVLHKDNIKTLSKQTGAEAGCIAREDSLPDAMTADEADILLSSR